MEERRDFGRSELVQASFKPRAEWRRLLGAFLCLAGWNRAVLYTRSEAKGSRTRTEREWARSRLSQSSFALRNLKSVSVPSLVALDARQTKARQATCNFRWRRCNMGVRRDTERGVTGSERR